MFIVFFRAMLLYICITFFMRLMGKRQLGEFQPSELVTTILISNIASLPIEDINIPMLYGVIPIIVLVSFELIVSNISLRNKPFRNFISGNPITIIENGVINQKMLARLRLSIDDLMESLRQNNVFDFTDVAYAITETNGKISVLLKSDAQTVTLKDSNIKKEDPTFPLVIISDGRPVKNSIQHYNIKDEWLQRVIKANACRMEDIFIMTADQNLKYEIVLKDKKQKGIPKI